MLLQMFLKAVMIWVGKYYILSNPQIKYKVKLSTSFFHLG